MPGSLPFASGESPVRLRPCQQSYYTQTGRAARRAIRPPPERYYQRWSSRHEPTCLARLPSIISLAERPPSTFTTTITRTDRRDWRVRVPSAGGCITGGVARRPAIEHWRGFRSSSSLGVSSAVGTPQPHAGTLRGRNTLTPRTRVAEKSVPASRSGTDSPVSPSQSVVVRYGHGDRPTDLASTPGLGSVES